MKRTIAAIALSLAAASAFADEDSTLYWMIDNPYVYNTHESIAFDYAKISVDDGTTTYYLNMYGTGGSMGTDELGADSGGLTAGPAYSGMFDSQSAKSFRVELYDASQELVGWRGYSMAEVAGSVFGGYSGGTGDNVFMVQEVIPEPTSGLLVALGLVALALKRRRADA